MAKHCMSHWLTQRSLPTALCADCTHGIISAVFYSLDITGQEALESLQHSDSSNATEVQIVNSLVRGINAQCDNTFFDGKFPSDTINGTTGSTAGMESRWVARKRALHSGHSI